MVVLWRQNIFIVYVNLQKVYTRGGIGAKRPVGAGQPPQRYYWRDHNCFKYNMGGRLQFSCGFKRAGSSLSMSGAGYRVC
ncbi:hypothetical protein ACPTH3_30460, partial [Pseudomonas aeruginosa]